MQHSISLPGFFDTNFDTNKFLVSKMSVKITPQTYIGSDGTSQLYLHATANRHRVRIPLKIYVNPKQWNRQTEKVKAVNIRKRVTFHVARHTFATRYLNAGGKVETLQKTLGHSNIRETMLYVHLHQEQMDDDISLLELFQSWQ